MPKRVLGGHSTVLPWINSRPEKDKEERKTHPKIKDKNQFEALPHASNICCCLFTYSTILLGKFEAGHRFLCPD